MKYILFIIISVLFSTAAIAEANTSLLTIQRIGTGWAGEGIYIYPYEEEIVESCSTARFFISRESVLFNEILSIALSALHTKSQVQFHVIGCENNSMRASSISIFDTE
jgi:hypothetical protein